MFVSSLYQQKTVKKNQNPLARNMKNRCIGMCTKQRMRVKISKDILSNQTL